MLDFLATLFGGIFGFLNDHLPNSPFQQWVSGASVLHDGLGYLNFFVPVGDLIGIFLAYVALLAIWIAVRAILGKTEGIAGKLIGS